MQLLVELREATSSTSGVGWHMYVALPGRSWEIVEPLVPWHRPDVIR